MKLIAHCLVKNEDRWIWYVINSVLDAVDEVLVWDTGSTDNTIEVIKSISSPKIIFASRLASTPQELTQARQEMLDQTRADWLLILDGDEIWTPYSLSQSLAAVKSQNNLDYLINSYKVLLGDVYHYQEEEAGRYQVGPYSGHVTIRFVNLKRLLPLRYYQDYPHESLRTRDGHSLQHLPTANTVLITSPYLHATHTNRTSLAQPQTVARSHLFKYELGVPTSKNFPYPKPFYYPHPKTVSSPWTRRSWGYVINAAWQTPLKYLKRRLIS